MKSNIRSYLSTNLFKFATIVLSIVSVVLLTLANYETTHAIANLVEDPFQSQYCLGENGTMSVALGDLDGNGSLDWVIGNDQGNEVWLNDGSGFFTDSGQRLGELQSREVKLADLDGDSDLDIYVANQFGHPNKVWFNDGDGLFVDSGQILGYEDSVDMALGDLDGDGDIDAYIANSETIPDEVWFNDGTGQFTLHQSFGNSSSEGVDLGDVDGDGDLDAFVVSYNSEPNRIWLHDGSGILSDSGQALGNADSGVVHLGDLDGDGDLDAFVGNFGPNKVYLNNGSGIFSDSGQNLGDLGSWAADLGDLDEDGDLDAFVGADNGLNQIWLNNGSGSFILSREIQIESSTWSVALGDLDEDGDLDVVLGNYGFNMVLFNDGLGDFTNSGQCYFAFVTGGGWIWSPEGAYFPDPTLTGKVTFGFVSKYKKDATVPTGNTEFQFKVADLNFHSADYQWLFVTGTMAMFEGTGSINGMGEYKFMIWAGDDVIDTFRIKIWMEDEFGEAIIYDNGFDQEIGGGNIIHHTK